MKCDVSSVSAASLKLNVLSVNLSHFLQNLDWFTSFVTLANTGRRTDNVVLLDAYHACYPIVNQRLIKPRCARIECRLVMLGSFRVI
jgi:hypothetical protein